MEGDGETDGDSDSDDLHVKLKRESGTYVKEYERSLSRLLWKSSADLIEILLMRIGIQLEHFQEDPQLLDRHLEGMVMPLVEAFSIFLTRYATEYQKIAAHTAYSDVLPLPTAVCSILYAFCKIRGYKVVIRFLSPKPQLLEPVLYAFERWNIPAKVSNDKIYHEAHNDEGSSSISTNENPTGEKVSDQSLFITWEEKYVMLLWMYHLAGVPFDLTSLSSISSKTPSVTDSVPFELPDGCPVIVARLISVSCHYLENAGREREAAVQLLTRLALLHDWHKIHLHHYIVIWVCKRLRASYEQTTQPVEYSCMGLMSFLANFISLATSDILEPFLSDILDLAQLIRAAQRTSTSIAKILIKLHRNLAVQILGSQGEALELTMSYLIDQLSANDTVVRLTASKALAKIISRLDQDLVMDLVAHIVEDLERDTYPLTPNENSLSPIKKLIRRKRLYAPATARYFGDVNACRWHGLTMCLSHMMYQHSIPSSNIAEVVDALTRALHFSQTNALGSLIGSNVRDAACFGFWALARKYSTAEVLATRQGSSFFQALANELIVAALLDPVGNVRRGASAALQEMIGRHPNMIDCGQDLQLVTAVDYHTIASKRKATWAAISVTNIKHDYWAYLLQGLISWRGARFEDHGARHKVVDENQENAALLISHLALLNTWTRFEIIPTIQYELRDSMFSRVGERVGLIRALAGVIFVFRVWLEKLQSLELITETDHLMMQVHGAQTVSLWGVLDVGLGTPSNPRPRAIQCIEAALLAQLGLSSRIRAFGPALVPTRAESSLCRLLSSLSSLDGDAAAVNSEAIKEVVLFLEPIPDEHPLRRIETLCSSRVMSRFSYLAIWTRLAFRFGDTKEAVEIKQEILNALVKDTLGNTSIELKVFALECMGYLMFHGVCTPSMIESCIRCLNDYTVNRLRGDVGQFVRRAAIKAFSIAFRLQYIKERYQLETIAAKICGLAVDKLDRLRVPAVRFLAENVELCGLAALPSHKIYEDPRLAKINAIYSQSLILTDSLVLKYFDAIRTPRYEHSQVDLVYNADYFEHFLSFSRLKWARSAILDGFVATAGCEYEDQIRASRNALINHTEHLSDTNLQFLCTDIVRIIRTQDEEDRLLIPTMEVISFLFESGIMNRLQQDDFWLDQLIDLINMKRYKTTNIRKLGIAVRIYRGLAKVERAKPKEKAISDLCKMLKHRYPIIRNAAADALLLATGPSQDLISVNWKRPTKENEDRVTSFRKRLGIAV